MTDAEISASKHDHAIPWVGKGTHAPFIFITIKNGTAQVVGEHSAFVGHRMHVSGDTRPRGMFAQWSWDGSCLTAEVDPLGYFNLYVHADSESITLSPSILQLLAHGAATEIDQTAVAVFHRIGCFVRNDTPFKQIRVLPPNGKLRWQKGSLQIEGGLPTTPEPLKITREQAVEALIEVPRAGIRRLLKQVDGPFTMPLSGGRDSRHILLELLHQHRPPDTCITFHHGGSSFNDEAQAARAITERAGLHHTLIGRPRRRVRDSVRALLMTQLCADEHGQMMPMHDFFVDRRSASWDGLGGDVLTTPNDDTAGMVAKARRGDFESMARKMAAGHAAVISHADHQGGAGTLYSADLEEAAIERIAGTLQLHEHAADPYQSFWFWNRSRREISYVSTAIMGNATAVLCPYMEPDMIELGLSLPWESVQDSKVHDDAIQQAYPDFADIPFSEGFSNPSLAASPLNRTANAVDAFRVAAMLHPDQPVSASLDLLRSSGLQRPHKDIYRLHNALLESIDASVAQRLMLLEENLTAAAPTAARVISDVFPGG